MKKRYIISTQGVHAPRLFSVEDKLKVFGEVEMLCNYRDVASVFLLTTEDDMCDAQKIKYAINGVLDPLTMKASIFRVDNEDTAETESCVEADNPEGFPYCFSRFKTVREALAKFEGLKPFFTVRDKRVRQLTFPEYLMCRYSDYDKDKISHSSYVGRFLGE